MAIIKRKQPGYETMMGDRYKPVDSKCPHKFKTMLCSEKGCYGTCKVCNQLVIIKSK